MPKPDIYKVAGMLVRDRKTLVVRSYKDTTTFMTAGGKPEGDETELQALGRELMEELTISIDPTIGIAKLGTYTQEAFNKPGIFVQIDTYVVESFDGEPVPNEEIVELKWLTSKELDDHDLATVVKHKIIPDMVSKGYID